MENTTTITLKQGRKIVSMKVKQPIEYLIYALENYAINNNWDKGWARYVKHKRKWWEK